MGVWMIRDKGFQQQKPKPQHRSSQSLLIVCLCVKATGSHMKKIFNKLVMEYLIKEFWRGRWSPGRLA